MLSCEANFPRITTVRCVMGFIASTNTEKDWLYWALRLAFKRTRLTTPWGDLEIVYNLWSKPKAVQMRCIAAIMSYLQQE